MDKLSYDFHDKDVIFHTSDQIGIDTNGNLNIRMGNNISMDMKTGQMHINSGWKKKEKKDKR